MDGRQRKQTLAAVLAAAARAVAALQRRQDSSRGRRLARPRGRDEGTRRTRVRRSRMGVCAVRTRVCAGATAAAAAQVVGLRGRRVAVRRLSRVRARRQVMVPRIPAAASGQLRISQTRRTMRRRGATGRCRARRTALAVLVSVVRGRSVGVEAVRCGAVVAVVVTLVVVMMAIGDAVQGRLSVRSRRTAALSEQRRQLARRAIGGERREVRARATCRTSTAVAVGSGATDLLLDQAARIVERGPGEVVGAEAETARGLGVAKRARVMSVKLWATGARGSGWRRGCRSRCWRRLGAVGVCRAALSRETSAAATCRRLGAWDGHWLGLGASAAAAQGSQVVVRARLGQARSSAVRVATMPVRRVVTVACDVHGARVMVRRRRRVLLSIVGASCIRRRQSVTADGRARSRRVGRVGNGVGEEAHVLQWTQHGTARRRPLGDGRLRVPRCTRERRSGRCQTRLRQQERTRVTGLAAMGAACVLGDETRVVLAVGAIVFAHGRVVRREAWRVLAAAGHAARVGGQVASKVRRVGLHWWPRRGVGGAV